MEQWVPIDGFRGYDVSDEGGLRGYKNHRGGYDETPHILKPRRNSNGYLIAALYDDRHQLHQIQVHRLVATAFVPNPCGYSVVDHIDGNKQNNRASNLEWVTSRENSRRAFENGLYEPIFEKTRCPVLVTDLRTGEETYFRGVNEAARKLGFSPAIISRAANLQVEKVGYYAVEFAGREDRLLFG